MQILILIYSVFFLLIIAAAYVVIKQNLTTLVKFRAELQIGQTVVVEESPDKLYQVKIIGISNSTILFEFEGKEWGVCERDKVFPVNHFLDENGFIEVSNTQII